jgi:hypothetical protein
MTVVFQKSAAATLLPIRKEMYHPFRNGFCNDFPQSPTNSTKGCDRTPGVRCVVGLHFLAVSY